MYALDKFGLNLFEHEENWYSVVQLALRDCGVSVMGERVLANIYFSGHGYLGRVQEQLRYGALEGLRGRDKTLDYILTGL